MNTLFDLVPSYRLVLAGNFHYESQELSVVYSNVFETNIHIYKYHAVAMINREAINIRPGDFTVMPPGALHSFKTSEPGDHWCLKFVCTETSDAEPIKLLTHGSIGTHMPIVNYQMEALSRLITMSGISNNHRRATDVLFEGFVRMLGVLQHPPEKPMGRPPRQFFADEVARIIFERYAEPLTIPQIARSLNVNQNYLAKMFRVRYKKTIPTFLLEYRLHTAKQLLVSTQLPVGTIAKMAGFTDDTYFSRRFKLHYNKTPSACR
jgi:AraC-like DNA-binding protein